MITDTKAVARYIPASSHGGMIRVEGCGDGTYVSDADHEAEMDMLRSELADAHAAIESKAGWEWKKEADRLRAENEALREDSERRLDLIRATVENSEWRHGSRNIYGELKREIQVADAAMENNNV